MPGRRWMAALLAAGWLAAGSALAQEPPDAPDATGPADTSEPEAEAASDEPEPAGNAPDVRRLEAARRAFDRGTAYALGEDYGRAAAQFETAYRLAPNPGALERAMQAHLRAGHTLRATGLALRLAVAHADHAPTRAVADEVLAAHAGDYVRLELDCADCILAVEGRVRTFHQVMLEPNTDHRVTIERGGQQRSHVVRGGPGERLRVGPPSPGDAVQRIEERPPGPDPLPGEPGPERPDPMPLPPWLFGSAAGLTVVAGAILIWSGVDTLAGVDEFNRMPTRRAFDEGEAKEARTNVLIGVTASLAALSLALAIFTDWGGAPPATAAGIFLDDQRAGVWARHRF